MSDEAKPPEDEAAEARKPASKKPAAKQAAAGKPAAKKATAGKPAAKKATAKTTPAKGAATAPESVAAADPQDAATQVIPETPTAVMPAAAPSPPHTGGPPPAPPFAPVPRTIERPGGGDRNVTIWLVVALAAVAVVAVILVWAFALRDTGEQFVGNWAPGDGSGGGLVISLADGDFTVSMYDEDLELLGSYPAARDGDVLTYRFTDTQSGRGQMKATLTYDEERDVLTLRMASATTQGAPAEYVRVDVLEAAATPTPAPSPTPTTTPTASPSASPTGSPSPSPSPSGTNTAVLDQQVVDGIITIQVGILDWSSANGGVFPSAAEVSKDGAVAQYVATWPTNPFTDQPMAPGSSKGDYAYEQLNGGQSYRLTGYLSSGTFTVP